MQVNNMKSLTGNKVPNQFIIIDNEGNEYFQSYRSIIAKKVYLGDRVKIYLDREFWNYSQTTRKYRNQFLGEGIAFTRSKIESGEYILTDLN